MALRQAHRGRRREQQAVERAQPALAPPGRGGRGAQRAARVAAEVMVGLVVPRPQRRIGGHGDEQEAAGPADAQQLAQRRAVVGGVLDHVQAGDQVKARVVPRDLLQPAGDDLAQPAAARHLGRVGVELEPADLAVVDQLLHRAARAAAGVEDPRGRGSGSASSSARMIRRRPRYHQW